MIFLGINKLVQSFQRPQIAQAHRASAKFVSLSRMPDVDSPFQKNARASDSV